MNWLLASAFTMLITAAMHSYFGEKRLIGPILSFDHAVTTNPLGRMVIRLAWHFTSVLMMLSAIVVIWPNTPEKLIFIVGGCWLACGLFDAVLTKRKHIGWPVITLAGMFAIMGTLP